MLNIWGTFWLGTKGQPCSRTFESA